MTNNINNLLPPSSSHINQPLSFVVGETPTTSSSSSAALVLTNQTPRKKRRRERDSHLPNPKAPRAKPDPSAPKITRPCTECGKKFWSWKALFGHMRCHPERHWRGINPPPNRTMMPPFTHEEHQVAASLLMLAHSPPPPPPTSVEYYYCSGDDVNVGRFECGSCKKVFGSHQALGGHRASHKNVKGCYAITKTDDQQQQPLFCDDQTTTFMMNNVVKDNTNNNNNGHKCSICFRVFSTGQALGGHMRCHWEKDDHLQEAGDPSSSSTRPLDLNLSAPPLVHHHHDSSSSGLVLDLRLGL